MFLEVLNHEYFWLSFFPISFLGTGFWFLFMERDRKQKDSLWLFALAIFAGILAALSFGFFSDFFEDKNIFINVVGEEFAKFLFALLAMEIFRQKFKTIAGGIIYGFAIGLGFALAENIVYLSSQYEIYQFSAEFWLTFQGRFWTSTILHGITMAFLGLFYAGAYLSSTIYREKNESPLTIFFKLPSFKEFIHILSFHVSREHLLFDKKPFLKDCTAKTIITEGLLIAIILHLIFNLLLEFSHPFLAFFTVLFFLWFLKQKIREI